MQTQITVTTKKGHSQVTTWTIVQQRPYPDVGDFRMAWRNGGQLFPAYGNTDPVGIGKAYRCDLDRNAAGTDKPASTIILRGEDLGQILIEPKDTDRNLGWTDIRIRNHERPTTSVRDWIAAQILPTLLETIATHRAELYAEALTSLRAHFAKQIGDLRTAVDRLEKEAADVMTKL